MSLHLAVKRAKEFLFGSRGRASKEKPAPSYTLYYAAKCLLAVQNSAGKFNQNPQKSNISESTTWNIQTENNIHGQKNLNVFWQFKLTSSSLMCQLTELIAV